MTQPRLWSIVLAAGRGSRLSAVTGGVPKQFWAPAHGPSLLEATVERVVPLVSRARIVTIVDRSHREHVATRYPDGMLGEVLYQPCDRGTAVGVLLPLSAIHAQDPDAIVVITPSDHGVARGAAFRAGLAAGVRDVEAGLADIILFGAPATCASTDFGWIVPASSHERPAGVASFVEKPAPHTAETLYRSGGVWNTMVLVARVGALIGLYRRHLPEALTAFAGIPWMSRGTPRDLAIDDAYVGLGSADFSRDVLGRADGLRFLTFETTMGWTDLGTPDRLRAWLSSLVAAEPVSAALRHRRVSARRSLRSA